jgi:peptide/nickel transport system substrate-binding protein
MNRKTLYGVIAILVAIIVIVSAIAVISIQPKKTTTTTPITFTIGVTQGTKTLDPAIAMDFTSDVAVNNLYDSLFSVALENGRTVVVPNVVTSYTVSPDGLNYTLNIRQGILFHDNSTLTAYDVAFSFNRMLTINQGLTYLWSGILTAGNVTALNSTAVKVHLLKPYAPFIATLVNVYVVNEKLVMQHLLFNTTFHFGTYGDYGITWLSSHDAGSGPYTLVYYDPTTKVVFKKFSEYWKGWGSNQPDTAVMEVFTEEASVKMAMESDTIDMTDYTLAISTYEALANVSGIIVKKDPSYNLLHIMMNCKMQPTNNLYVRQAFSYAFDYNTAITKILPGDVQAQGPVVNTMYGHNDSVLTYNFNLTKARELLNKSGYTPSQLSAMNMKIVYVNSLEWEAQIAAMFKYDLAQLGINITLEPLPWMQMVSLTSNYTTEPTFFILSSTAPYPDPSYYLMRYTMNATGYTSAFFYKNQSLSNLIMKAVTTLNNSERLKLYGIIQEDIAYQAPCIWFANDLHKIAYWNYVHGYQFYGVLGKDIYFWNFHIYKNVSSSLVPSSNVSSINYNTVSSSGLASETKFYLNIIKPFFIF